MADKSVYAVVVEDRRVDTEITLFYSLERAMMFAKGRAVERASDIDDIDEMGREQLEGAGLLYQAVYSVEGDFVWVKELQVL